ncbi:MAG TPA: phage tail protein [Solirubrobacteraceae bacterium]|jgi:phage tail-like protein
MAPKFVHYVVLEVPNITQNTYFLGIFKGMEGLEVWFDVLEYAEGGNNDFVHRLPGRMRYPNLKLSWGLVSDDALLKWFLATHTKAETQEITLTLTAAKGDLSRDLRKFTFTDAYPVHWSGPHLHANAADPETWGETLEIAHSGLKLGP